MPNQIYEKYWEITFAWTDYYGGNFLLALKEIINFIDEHKEEEYSANLYSQLQQKLIRSLSTEKSSITEPSIRKGINQFVKMGFVEYHLIDYHPLAKKYIEVDNKGYRKFLLSKILYSNSSFSRSVTKESHVQEINFFLKTLEHNEKLNENLLPVLMRMNIAEDEKGYATQEELEQGSQDPSLDGFISRKYNQISYFKNLLKEVDGVFLANGIYTLYETESASEIKEIRSVGRDPYLQKIYKDQLKKEVASQLGDAQCMVERLSYPVLIASHIKPYKDSSSEEAFDPDNGLLLSKNIDSLFDLRYLSFNDDGSILFYERIPEDVKEFLIRGNYSLNPLFLNDKRKQYLAYHRDLCQKENA
ncbi:HNH endonuclease [Candidatus Avelusimicrobium fimicolum]|uniref:HNH endonuclease n=1 Tax=Candidatus Avelusimicrobium fimicolum TaxID=3416216 RepID=UPI003D0EA199